MDVIDLLTNDHAAVSALFGRFKRSSKPQTKQKLANEIIHELSVHAAVEENLVYPLMRVKLDNGSDKAHHAIEEHQEVKRLLADIEKLDPGDSEFDTTMEQVTESVRHHVAEEERDLLPELRSKTSPETRERLGTVVEKAKGLVPTHPHPLVPGTATAQLVAGPWASIIDHVRDVVNAA
jgi:hemerythrin superfamily protein